MPDPSLMGQLEELLRDATLLGVSARGDRVSIRLHCLRRNPDGTEVADPCVELVLSEVAAIAAAYDPAGLHERPSRLVVPEDVLIADLSSLRDIELPVDAGVGLEADREQVELAARTDFLRGTLEAGRDAAVRLAFRFERGEPELPVMLWLAAGDIEARSGGAPLATDLWLTQHRAWWKRWSDHWQSEAPNEPDHEPVEEDTMIPAMPEPPADLAYRPPAEPAFELDPSDAPAELIEPLRAWFEALFAGDWETRAKIFRDLDLPLEEQARRLRQAGTGHEFGRWGYARAIDEWWVEGRRAFVRVRGIEHTMALEDDPAESLECVWDLALRRRDGRWSLSGYSQGWPRYGSAAALPLERKPWLSRWSSGKVAT